MAYTTGVASGHHDLLAQLRTWITGTVGWTETRWTAPAGDQSNAELWVRGPGAGASRAVEVGFKSYWDLSLPTYSLGIRATPAFDSGEPFEAMPDSNPTVYLNLWNSTINYWFYANDRRIIIIAQVSTSYCSAYAGFFLPFALPNEYPFPLYVGAPYMTPATFDVSNTRNRMIADPGYDCGHYRTRGSSSWQRMWNQSNNTTDYYGVGGEETGHIWPHRVSRVDSVTSVREYDWSQWGGFYNFRPNENGEMPMIQCHIVDTSNETVAGALDGVFAAPGFGRATEQVITANGRDFRIFQNIFRSTGRDFMAIEEI